MCTISWLAMDDELHVHFNRDEAIDREFATPPDRRAGTSSDFIAPLDPRSGGTWLTASADGSVRALLNYHDSPFPIAGGGPSRGVVPFRLASGFWSLSGLLDDPTPMAGIRPFHLMIITINGAIRHTWDGGAWHHSSSEFPASCFTTSSWNSREVTAVRLAAFARLFPSGGPWDPADLARFHDGLETGGDPAASVLMDRTASRTVSQTRVHITQRHVNVSYRSRETADTRFCPFWIKSSIPIQATL